MAMIDLSTRDMNVLEKIKDPESNPVAGAVIDPALPRDPQIVDNNIYEGLVERERTIIRALEKLETQLNWSGDARKDGLERSYRECLSELNSLISDWPLYASARNNRAQMLRRLYGDTMLLSATAAAPDAIVEQPDQAEQLQASATALGDLDRAISLLTPRAPESLSRQAARTLSMAYTQRAALYLKTSKLMSGHALELKPQRREAIWSKIDFEEAASRDFALGGRYGNPIAKGLAVSVNPTAKLCGQIVREAMKKEYGPIFGA